MGNVTPNGGVYISMSHLGPENVRRMFKGMVGTLRGLRFRPGGGLVEVVPTAHYMMGGVVFEPDCTTDLPGLFVAGEDSGGVHGANRLGGNGVANSTVFGGIAGDRSAGLTRRAHSASPTETRSRPRSRARAPAGAKARLSRRVPRRLYDLMWDDVGIVRDAASLARAGKLAALEAELDETGIADCDLAFNLTWHDWLNLESLLLVSNSIRAAAEAREDSRGAHFRADFPRTGDLATSRYTCVPPTDGGRDGHRGR